MSSTDSQADAGAMIYAKALFSLAEKGGGKEAIDQTNSEIEAILEIARADKMFNEFLSSRVFPAKRRAASLKKIFEGKVSDLTLRFLQVLNRKNRLGYLGSIASAFDQLVQESFGRVEADVYTAQVASPAELQLINERLNSAMKKEVVLHPYTDPSMIGGVKVQIGDQLIDASVATQLRRMREKLMLEGASKLRSKIDSILTA